MKCPFCESEMVEGYITGNYVFWSPDSFKIFMFTRKKAGELKLTGERAYKCENCKKVMIDYKQ
jgi:ssDNA-binding Zn-finger/Zn-ribbon topoisomerase 1